MDSLVKKYNMPDKHGHFEEFGGKYVPETLIPALDELEQEYFKSKKDKNFQKEFFNLLKYYGGRPTPLYLAKNISEELGFNVWLKREDLNHTGAHKINNALGQILLARKMGKKRIIAETGAGQHGVATAVEAICKVANKYQDKGRGKIFILPIEECIRIRTNEKGKKAIG